MDTATLHYLSLKNASELIRRREISATELTQAMLDRVDALQPKFNCFISIFHDEAMHAAAAADKHIQSGRYLGPMHGIPFAVKDVFDSGRTTAGSKLHENFVAETDASAVARIKGAGGILLGKQSTYEFAAGAPTESSYFKPARNPWNMVYDPGGSSSGSAASVAAGLVFGALGSDSGGSIRWPASSCGIVGMKATYGLVSRAGLVPLSWSMDHAGPLARTVEDCAILLQACAGYDRADPTSARRSAPDFSTRLGRDIAGIRIGVPHTLFRGNCAPEILKCFDDASQLIQSLGAELVEIESISMEQLRAAFWPIILAEAAAYHEDDFTRRSADYFPDLRLILALGEMVGATSYLQCQRARIQIREQMLDQLQNVDLFMLPISGGMTGPVLQESPGLYPLDPELKIYTPLFNLTGFPAMSVPCGFNETGLPIGFQLGGRPFDEATLLQVAYAYQQAAGFHLHHPDV